MSSTDKENVVDRGKDNVGAALLLFLLSGSALAVPPALVLVLELVEFGVGVLEVVDVLDVSPAPPSPPAVRGTSVGELVASLAFWYGSAPFN
jgi:hypothetical protein